MIEYINNSGWKVAKAKRDIGWAILRFRTPVFEPEGRNSHPTLLTILWAFADENTGVLPNDILSDEMRRFEDLLVEEVERDGLGLLTAALTFDGARQWVFYTSDLNEFAQRLSTIPDYDGEPYPIELTTQEDPEWAYLRSKILAQVPREEWGH